MSHENLAQSVTLTLANGKKLLFSGPVQLTAEDEGVLITNIKFSEPIPLPLGTYWKTPKD